ncbi:carbohydrate kinase [Betaproteobacteria bacterium SCN2]|jgi:fructokinase|nr:carbohydrate kinase [Betaproteobacteria bacterium SCN2]
MNFNDTPQGTQYPVLVFGEVLFDQFPDRTVLGGAPFNVARHLAGFGWPPLMISRIGRDDAHAEVLRAMERYGLDASCIQIDPLHPTGSVQVELNEAGHRFEILDNQAYDYIHQGMARLGALAARPQLVYYGTLAARHTDSCRALLGVLRLSPGLKFLDLNLRAPWYERSRVETLMRHAHVLKLNDEEFEVLGRWHNLKGSLEAMCLQILNRYDLRLLLLTRGDQGAYAAMPDGRGFAHAGSALDAPIVDSVGAGDAFSAVAIAGLLSDWPMDRLLERADAFARKILGIRGAVPDDRHLYQQARAGWEENP